MVAHESSSIPYSKIKKDNKRNLDEMIREAIMLNIIDVVDEGKIRFKN